MIKKVGILKLMFLLVFGFLIIDYTSTDIYAIKTYSAKKIMKMDVNDILKLNRELKAGKAKLKDEEAKRALKVRIYQIKRQLLQQRLKKQIELQKKLEELEQKDRKTRREAIRSYENFLKRMKGKKDIKVADALFQLGELWYQEEKDQFMQAMAKYEKLMEKYEKGKLKKEPQEPQKNYKKAISYLKRLVNEYPDYPDRDVALYKLGIIYEEMGENKEALKYFKELAYNYPKSKYAERAYLRVGRYFYEENQIDSALAYFKKVSMEGAGVENWGVAQYMIAKCYNRLGKTDEAIQQFFQYISLVDQGYFKKANFKSESIEELASIYAELPKGAKRCEQDIDAYYPGLKSQEAYLFFRIGEKAREYDKLDNALFAFKYLLKKYPYYKDAPKAQNYIVEIYTLQQKYDKANKARIELVEKYNKDSEWAKMNTQYPKRIIRAMEYVEQALSLIPLYYHTKADKEHNKEYYKKAIKYYELYIKWFSDKDPFKIYEYRFYLAACYLAVGRYREAAKTFDDIVAMDTSKFPEDRLKKLKFDKETAAYNAVLAYQGIMDEEVKDFKKQFNTPAVQDYIAACKRYLKLFPDRENADAIAINLAAVYYKSERYDSAIVIYQQIVRKGKKSKFYKDALRYLGQAYLYAKKYQEAENIFKKYLEEFPNISNKEKENMLALLGSAIFKQAEQFKKEGDSLKAIEYFMRIHKEAPNSKVADIGIYNAAVTYEQMKRYKDAAKTFIYLAEVYPKSKYAIPALFRAAENYKVAKLYDSAAVTYVLVAKKYPDSTAAIAAIYTSALMYDSLKMYYKAGQQYELVYKMFPKHKRAPEGLYSAGLMYEKAEKWDDAIRVYRLIESKYPNSEYLTDAVYSVAVTYKKQKKWKLAGDYFAKFADKYYQKDPPKVLLAYMDAVDCYLKTKKINYDQVNTWLDKALEVYKKYAKKYGIDAYYAAKAVYLKGEVVRNRMNSIPLSGTKIIKKGGEYEFKVINKKQDEKKLKYLKQATEFYVKTVKFKVEEWTLKANNAIGYLMAEYAAAIDTQKIVPTARSKTERKTMEIGARVYYKLKVVYSMYLKAADRFKVNVEYGIKNRITNDAIEEAKLNFSKMLWMAAKTILDAGKLLAESPIPPGLSEEEKEYYKAALEEKIYEAEEKALPLLEQVVLRSYELYIDNEYVQKAKDKIREINPDDKVLLARVKTPDFEFKVQKKHDPEYELAIKKIDNIDKLDIPYEEKLAQLTSMKLTAKRRIDEEKEKIEKLKLKIKLIDKRIDALVKEIYKLGGGTLDTTSNTNTEGGNGTAEEGGEQQDQGAPVDTTQTQPQPADTTKTE